VPALACSAETRRLVLLPLENPSAAAEAPALIAPLIEEKLRERGWDLAPAAAVEKSLAAARIRRLDSLPAGARETLLAELEAEGYVATSILAFRSKGMPLVAVAVRLVGVDGKEIYGEAMGLSAEDTLGVLDDRPSVRSDELARRVAGRLFDGFPRPGRRPKPDEPPGAPFPLGSPASFRSAALDAMPAPRRIAILPFRSFGVAVPEAPRIAAELTRRWLVRSRGFEPVEAADLRAALAAEKVRDPARIDPDLRSAIGRRLGASLFLQGTIFRWKPEPPSGSQAAPPEVEFSLLLVDAASARILWASYHHRLGNEYKGLLGLGGITNVVALADRVLGEMVEAGESGKAVRVPEPAAPRP
jgi:hypothetical protein